MRIALDVMGGDRGCRVVIEGARLALRAHPRIATLYLVGDQVQIKSALSVAHQEDSRLQIVHAS
ncbi:MAG TPA: phosphate acyltransferase PlsX, partial [Verrucomicrobiota bacterium]|nr:phosphate acyltransferase PlsX [Verrucomicrobiota bacterium]